MKGKPAVFGSLASSGRRIAGTLVPPADKSITHRAVIFAALSPRASRIRNPLLSGDCLSTVGCFKGLGVPIRVASKEIRVGAGEKSPDNAFRKFKAPRAPLDCGNSGTTMRLLSGILAAQPFKSRLFGDASLSRRPMGRVIEPLERMGARIRARKGRFAPLDISGNPDLSAITWKSPVASAQVKSAILLAGLFARGRTTLREPVRSRDHSERLLKSLGAAIRFDASPPVLSAHEATVQGGGPGLAAVRLTVPGDFSSAAFWIAAALLVPGSDLTIQSVNLNPTRKGLLDVLKAMGARIRVKNFRRVQGEPQGDLRVRHSRLRGATVRKARIPLLIDEIPILAVLATQARGRTVISGAEELRVKESDRLAAMASQLAKMGAKVREKRDGLIIEGPTPLRGAVLESFHDHRIALSLAVAALVAQGRTSIRNFSCIRISYPGFLKDLKRLARVRP